MLRILSLACALFLAACAANQSEDASQPLSATEIRRQLSGHTMQGLENDQHYLIYLYHNGVAKHVAATAEYGHWYITPGGGLCMQWHDQPATCAPLYQSTVSHYRWGETPLTDLDAGARLPGIPERPLKPYLAP